MNEEENLKSKINLEKEYEALMAANLESFKATIQYAVIGLRSLFLMNGGAILALITFAGAKTIDEKGAEVLSVGLMLYSIGLVCVLLATGMSYFAQSYYSRTFAEESADFKTATRWRYTAVFCAILSLGCFIAASNSLVKDLAKLV